MSKVEVYESLLKNKNSIIDFVDGAVERKMTSVSVDHANPQYEYESLTGPFLYFSRFDQQEGVMKIAWKNVKKINGIPYKHAK